MSLKLWRSLAAAFTLALLAGHAGAQTTEPPCPPDTEEVIYVCTFVPIDPVKPVPPPPPVTPSPPPTPYPTPGPGPSPVPTVPYPPDWPPPGWPWPWDPWNPWWPFDDPCHIAPDLCRPLPELPPMS